MIEILKRLSGLDLNTVIITFFMNNWLWIVPAIAVLFWVTYVKYSESKSDDKFLKILTDHLKAIFNFVRMKGFKK